ncbi:MAG: hypothetical protein ACI4J4_07340 [Ruminiclostridium sp.]
MLRKILLYAGSFLAAIILLWSALILTALVPNEAIKDNLMSSVLSLNGADPFFQSAGRNSVTDNYADVILLNVIWNIDSKNPVASSLDTKYYDGNDGVTDNGENYGLYAALNGEEPNTDYSRYWHGSAVFIRPLLAVTDLSGIRLTGAVFALILLAVSCALLIRRKHYAQTAALVLSLVCVQAWNICLAMEYQPAVLVTLAMLPLFILLEKKGDMALILLSVISGVLIAFFDFLTAETLTILIPLIIVLSIRFSEGRFLGAGAELLRALKCSAGWLLAYCGTFLAKWTAASLVTGENKFTAALTSAEERFGGSFSEMSVIEQIFAAPFANISTMFGANERGELLNGIIGAVILLSAAVLILYLSRKKKAASGFIITVLILGAIPYLRYSVLSNHSYLHEFFTYRAQAAAVLALITGTIAGLQKEKVKEKEKKSKNSGKGKKGKKRAANGA